MINKLIWTKKDPANRFSQFEFALPTGFKVYTVNKEQITSSGVTSIDLGVYVTSKEPITLFFTPTIYSKDFTLVQPIVIIPPNQKIELNLLAVNPDYESDTVLELDENQYIANMVVINTSYTNLFEVNNKEFGKI